VHQLSGVETSFLTMENATTYGHVGNLSLFDPGPTGARLSVESVRERVAAVLEAVPPLRQRLATVPFGLDRPYWIEDPDFDIEQHIHHIAVPPPGSREQLADLVARLHARHLDRGRPLWELYVIDGLEGGLQAQYTKIHHCAVDGVTGRELMSLLLDPSRRARGEATAPVPWSPDRSPTKTEMLARGLLSLAEPRRALKFQRRLWRTMVETSRGQLPGVLETARESLERNPLARGLMNASPGQRPTEYLSEPALSAPRVSFNQRITAHRRFAFTSLPLDDIKAVKTAFGTTVNDVVMAICAGALRTWLIGRHELPTEPLLAMVPLSVRTAADANERGSRISPMIAVLPTNEADPAQRLLRASEAMAIAKERHQATPASLLTDLAHFTPPAVAAAASRVVAAARIADLATPPFNVTISNIPGGERPLFAAGAQLLAPYVVGVINDGVGLSITAASYHGKANFGLLACRELVTDLWSLADGLEDALDELRTAAEALPPSTDGSATAGDRAAARSRANGRGARRPAARRPAAPTSRPES
jgi:WS/DGAT/MGAT family acyltransferase